MDSLLLFSDYLIKNCIFRHLSQPPRIKLRLSAEGERGNEIYYYLFD